MKVAVPKRQSKFDPDNFASHLIDTAKFAKTMSPASWKHGITVPAHVPGGGEFGKLLPGKGLYVDFDLKQFGITKPLPHVYEKSITLKLLEIFNRLHLDERGAITTYDGIITARGAGTGVPMDVACTKSSFTTSANNWFNLFRASGLPPAGTYLNTTAPTDALPDRSTTGALSQQLTNPGGSNKKYLLTFGLSHSVAANMLFLVDQLYQAGGFRLSVNTAETITTPTVVTRNSGGLGNVIIFTVTTAGTPGAGNFTVQYVDQASANTNAPVIALTATAVIADQVFPGAATTSAAQPIVPVAAATTGVKALKQTTCSVTGTGTIAGTVNFPLMFVPGVAVDTYVERDSTAQIDGLLELPNASQVIGCLNLYLLASGTTSGRGTYFIRTCEG